MKTQSVQIDYLKFESVMGQPIEARITVGGVSQVVKGTVAQVREACDKARLRVYPLYVVPDVEGHPV